MGSHKLTDVGNPENNNDAVNKQYVDQLIEHEHDTKPYDLGRYIVFPHDDGTKVYFSVRARKNVNQDREKLVELKHNIRDSSENEFNDRPQDLTITKDVELLPNPGKKNQV